ncbi:MAG: GGDEF domain-containing protein, partial [Thermoleophilia bacterium]|nr:GGDEF domain-containing protein [Thermoleophilia bacterium]
MLNIARLAAVLVVFVTAVAGVVWTTATEERRIGQRQFDRSGAAHELVDALLARESALRGFGESHCEGFLLPYDEATAALAAAADRARELADGNVAELELITEQERLADRWAGIANDTIIRIRNGRPVPAESTAARNELVQRFRNAHEELHALIDEDGESDHDGAVRRAVLLIVLLAIAFALAGALLLARMRRREEQRQSVEADDHASQREFAETLQVTQNEGEAHALVKRHLERSLAATEVVVLNRNNSQNRLEPATPVDAESPLGRKLVDSSPSSCLAVRLGRTHVQSVDAEPLLTCALCAGHERTTCTPSLVGGEVIGSVLLAHEQPLTDAERSRVDQSVSQAAPVLANLRNLALAEVRAATDGLTGLPNARSLRESLVRMVAQASRSELPLAAVLCDLDNFKQINDVYGHEKGDQALAAASAALRSSLRESDIAGRYGGEEFLILLPNTPLDGALVLAEKLREEVSLVEVPGVDRAI